MQTFAKLEIGGLVRPGDVWEGSVVLPPHDDPEHLSLCRAERVSAPIHLQSGTVYGLSSMVTIGEAKQLTKTSVSFSCLGSEQGLPATHRTGFEHCQSWRFS